MQWLRNLFGGARATEVRFTEDGGALLASLDALSRERRSRLVALLSSSVRVRDALAAPDPKPVDVAAQTQAIALPNDGIVLINLRISNKMPYSRAKRVMNSAISALRAAKAASGSQAQFVVIPGCIGLDVSVITPESAPAEA